MQNFPTASTHAVNGAASSAAAFFGPVAMPAPGLDSERFERAMDKAMDEIRSRAESAAEKASQASRKARPEARTEAKPEAKTEAGGGASGKPDPASVKVRAEDVEDLRDELSDMGVDSAEIDKLAERAGSEEGLTWAELADRAAEAAEAVRLTERMNQADRQRLYNFFQKIGFTQSDAERLTADLAQGRGASVLAEASEALAKLPETDKLAIDAQEWAALVRQSGGSRSALGHTVALLSGRGGKFTPAELREAMGELRLDVARQDREGRGAARMREIVNEAMLSARDEKVRERRASRMNERRGEDLRLTAEARRREESEKSGQKASAQKMFGQKPEDKDFLGLDIGGKAAGASTQTSAQAQQPEGAQDQAVLLQSNSQETLAQDHGPKTDPRLLDAAQRAEARARMGLAPGDSKNFAGDAGDKGEKGDGGWSALFAKVRAEGFSLTRETDPASARLDPALLAAAAGQTRIMGRAEMAAAAGAGPLSERLVEQVQYGVLTGLSENAKRLTLELNPENLGRLSLILQSRDSEIRAVIKADNLDTGRLITEQIAAIRESLEARGLKVAEIEVRAEVRQDQNRQSQMSAGQDAWNHNQAREREQAEFGRSHRRSMLLASSARAVQNDGHLSVQAEKMSGSGASLHLIA